LPLTAQAILRMKARKQTGGCYCPDPRPRKSSLGGNIENQTAVTANEVASTLLKAGADKVTLTVVAKAESPWAYSSHWQL